MLKKSDVERIFYHANAIITDDHFVYAKKPDGWYHGSAYVNKDAVYPYVSEVSKLCNEFAIEFVPESVDVVVGPTVGAVSLAQWTTYWLNKIYLYEKVVAVCADEEDVFVCKEILPADIASLQPDFEFLANGMVNVSLSQSGKLMRIAYMSKVGTRRVIKRGYEKHVSGKRCFVVEDIVNSGATVVKTCDAILQTGGEVVGVACLCNRSGGKVTAKTLGVPKLFSLLDLDMKMYKEDECPICAEGGRGSVHPKLGKGKEFLARIGINPGDK